MFQSKTRFSKYALMRKAGGESNVNKLVWVIAAILFFAIVAVAVGTFVNNGATTVSKNAGNAQTSITGTSGTVTSGGMSGSYSGDGTMNFGTAGN